MHSQVFISVYYSKYPNIKRVFLARSPERSRRTRPRLIFLEIFLSEPLYWRSTSRSARSRHFRKRTLIKRFFRAAQCHQLEKGSQASFPRKGRSYRGDRYERSFGFILHKSSLRRTVASLRRIQKTRNKILPPEYLHTRSLPMPVLWSKTPFRRSYV